MRVLLVGLCVAAACGADDGGELVPDAGDAERGVEAELQPRATAPEVDRSLAGERERLFRTYAGGADVCATWNQLDASARAVFLTITDRLYRSTTADDATALSHVAAARLILGGGADGSSCGGAENNRVFLSMDPYLWQAMVDTWDGAPSIDDGAGGSWLHTGDVAGPHDPFDASNETESGLRCAILIELPDSEPPTGQVHFFQDGSAVPVSRGAGIDLDADPYLLEMDLDFDCLHQSNPTCGDFEQRYRDHYGDFECEWLPAACTAATGGCYSDAL